MKNDEKSEEKQAVALNELRRDNIRLRETLEKYYNEKAELHESIRRLMFAMDATSDGIWDFDLITRKAYYSPHWSLMLGYEPAAIKPCMESFENLIHTDDRSAVLEALARHMENQAVEFKAEYRLTNREGGWQWILGRGNVVEWLPGGQPSRMVGTHTDISQLKHIQVRLRESEDRFRAVIESSPDSIIITSDTKTIEY